MARKAPEFKTSYKTTKARSRNMSHIHSKGTSIEDILTHYLWHSGVRYRRNLKKYHGIKLPGKPDIAITKYRILVFCDGDYWHGYKFDEYKKNHWHRNRKYWIHKITYNIKRDKKQTKELKQMGWTVLRFWGHTIKKHPKYCTGIIKYYIRYSRKENENNFTNKD